MNPETVRYINMFFGIGVMILQAFTLLAIILLLSRSKENWYLSFIKKNFIKIGFFLSFSALLVSTFYSEIVGYVPCFHCWIQRIFIFPQTLLFGIAWFRKDRNVIWYSLALTTVGLLDALYLTYIYYFNLNSAPCDASGVSCIQRVVSEFGGYISIPTISLSGFIALLTLVAVAYFYKKEV